MKSVKKSVLTVILAVMVMAVVSLGSVNAASTIPDLSIGGDTTSGTAITDTAQDYVMTAIQTLGSKVGLNLTLAPIDKGNKSACPRA